MSLRIYVELRSDGELVEGFPYRAVVDPRVVERFRYLKVPDPAYQPLPVETMQELEGLLIRNNQIVCYRLNGQGDGQIEMEPGGVFLAIGIRANDGPETNATAFNDTAEVSVLLQGLGYGVGVDDAEV